MWLHIQRHSTFGRCEILKIHLKMICDVNGERWASISSLYIIHYMSLTSFESRYHLRYAFFVSGRPNVSTINSIIINFSITRDQFPVLINLLTVDWWHLHCYHLSPVSNRVKSILIFKIAVERWSGFSNDNLLINRDSIAFCWPTQHKKWTDSINRYSDFG